MSFYMVRPLRGLPYLALAFALAISTLALLLLTTSARAESSGDTPDAPGSISGTVTNEAGELLAGIEVTLYRNREEQMRSPIVTDQAGRYAMTVLGAGIYQLKFEDTDGVYGFQYYDNAGGLEDAVDLVVAGRDIDGIDAVLSGGGGITGIVTFSVASGQSYYHTVEVWRAENDQLSLVNRGSNYYEHDDEDGFEFHGLRPGTYYICVRSGMSTLDPGREQVYRDISECFDDKAVVHYDYYDPPDVPTTITAIEVKAGETTGPIIIVLGDEADRATLAGSIQSANGQPVRYARVELYPEAYRWRALFTGLSDITGAYIVTGVAPGDYFVRIVDPAGEYVNQCLDEWESCEYPFIPSSDELKMFSLAPYETHIDVNATLNQAAQVGGVITINDRVPPEGGRVYFSSALGGAGGNPPQGSTEFDGGTGAYTLAGIAPGTYLVWASAYVDQEYFNQYYGAEDGQEPISITVGYGDHITAIDIDLEPDAYEGVIRGHVNSDEAPLANIRVEIAHQSFANQYDENILVYTDTDQDGDYRLEGLNGGDYYFRFSDPTGEYATVYSASPQYPYRPEYNYLNPGRETITYSVTLSRAGLIKGQVILPEGESIDDYLVQSYFMTTGGDFTCTFFPPGNDYQCYFGPGSIFPDCGIGPRTTPAADGAYTLQGLYPGTYRIALLHRDRFPPPDRWQPTHFYPNTRHANSAADIILASGDVVENIDLNAAIAPRQYMPFIAR